jgi:IS4 transposase
MPFCLSDETDAIVTIDAPRGKYSSMRKDDPDITFIPIKLRLVKYTFDGTTYVLGTTLLDSEAYSIGDLSDLYHARSGVEERYKILKELIDVEDFHGQSERGIKQEPYAYFVLITLSRNFGRH